MKNPPRKSASVTHSKVSLACPWSKIARNNQQELITRTTVLVQSSGQRSMHWHKWKFFGAQTKNDPIHTVELQQATGIHQWPQEALYSTQTPPSGGSECRVGGRCCLCTFQHAIKASECMHTFHPPLMRPKRKRENACRWRQPLPIRTRCFMGTYSSSPDENSNATDASQVSRHCD